MGHAKMGTDVSVVRLEAEKHKVGGRMRREHVHFLFMFRVSNSCREIQQKLYCKCLTSGYGTDWEVAAQVISPWVVDRIMMPEGEQREVNRS